MQENLNPQTPKPSIRPLSQKVPMETGNRMKIVEEKDLGITDVRGARANIKDVVVFGDGDTFALLCKASSPEQGWMKSTKVCNVPGGCTIQVTTQQRNPDRSYAIAEALTYVPGVMIDTNCNPRQLVPYKYYK